jgi:hypothetical protein
MLAVKNSIKKQRKMGKLLLKEIKKDPPKGGAKSLCSLSDSITIKYMDFIKNKDVPKIECAVQKQAFEYAASILEGKELMVELVKDKNEKEKEKSPLRMEKN